VKCNEAIEDMILITLVCQTAENLKHCKSIVALSLWATKLFVYVLWSSVILCTRDR